MFLYLYFKLSLTSCARLLEYADQYYNLKDFPAGEAKNALIRANNKRLGRTETAQLQAGDNPRKKKKKEHEPYRAAYEQRSLKSGSNTPTTNKSGMYTPTLLEKADYTK